MARIYLYRGKTSEELQALSQAEFQKLVPSRQRRSLKRQGMVYKELQEKVERIRKKDAAKVIKTDTREAVILPGWLGLRFAVHNGKEFKDIKILPEMIGHRLGEYVFSTKRVQHSAPGIRATRGSKFLSVK
jgi:small subunit ribosomal protein S19